MKDQVWNEIDLKTVESLEEYIQVQQQLIEHTKRIVLRIKSKYQLPESKQPHNMCR